MPLLNGMAAVPMIMAQRAALAYRAAASVVINTTDAQLLTTAASRKPVALSKRQRVARLGFRV